MSELKKCRACGVDIQSNAPFGHCPKCLLELGFSAKPDDAMESVNHFAPGAGAINTVRLAPVTEAPGDYIDRYKLLQKIGEGGCGVVYMAEQQEPIRRRVALKVIKPGMDTREVIARFEAERQALAMMDHPNIAKVLDVGQTDTGRPFFVMELVKGVRITDYCDQNNLPTHERLVLFTQVCQAVQHAHQKGIIHRDIKPSNILVTLHDGVRVPKVIDFGIAKAINQQRLTDITLFTAFGQLIGTPAYMSPEQAEMSGLDIDTRCDIYALGVLLYELLVGRTPFDAGQLLQAGLDEMRRIIREQEPPKPSTRLITLTADDLTSVARHRQCQPARLTHLMRGDLDWIVMKCLEKDRMRRYETANGLAMDVQRHLQNEAVIARPASNLYRFQKTVRRHKLAFTAGAAVLTSLILGLGTTTVLFFKEQAALRSADSARFEVIRQKAEVELKKAEVDRKNVELHGMLAEAGRSDRLVAEEKFCLGQEREAFAHLARACEYDRTSTMAAEKGVSMLGAMNHVLPTAILAGHTGVVMSAAFSPDGNRLVSASWDRTARVWDSATGHTLQAFVGHTGRLWSAQFSPDGKRIVTASDDKTARVWDADTGLMLAALGHTKPVYRAEFSHGGTRLLTVSGDKTARVWHAHSGRLLLTLTGYTNICIAAHFSPDGTRIVTAGDGIARVWDVDTGKTLVSLAGHTRSLRCAGFSSDGTRVVTGSADSTARVWDVLSGNTLVTLLGHTGWVENAQFSHDGLRVVTAGRDDKTVRIWDAVTGKLLRVLTGHKGAVHSAQFSPDGVRIVSADWSSTALLWDASTGKALTTLAGHQEGTYTAYFSPDGQRIVTAAGDKTARVWNIETLQSKAVSPPFYNHWTFSRNGKRLFTASHGNISPRLWDLTNGRLLATLGGHTCAVWSGQFNRDDTLLATASADSSVRLWDANNGTALATLAGHTGAVVSVSFSADGTRIVTGAKDMTARVWDVTTKKELAILAGHTGTVLSARFSLNGTRILTTASYEPVRVWDTASGKLLSILGDPWKTFAQFSPDGSRVVTVSQGISLTNRQYSTPGPVLIWDALTGQRLITLFEHAPPGSSAEFGLNGTRIITSATYDEPARLWDATTGKTLTTLGFSRFESIAGFSPDGTRFIFASFVVSNTGGGMIVQVRDSATGKVLATLAGHTNFVRSAQFSPDGKRVVTASDDKTARVWDGESGKLKAIITGDEELQSAEVTSEGTHIITTSVHRRIRVRDLLPQGAGPPPDWFPDFLRYIAQMRITTDGVMEPIKAADWLELRSHLSGILRANATFETPYIRILRKYVHE